MSIEAGVIVWLAIVIVTDVIVSYLAHRWGRDPFGWVLLSAAMGPVALVGLIGAHSADRDRSPSPCARSASAHGPIVACDGSDVGERLAAQVMTVGEPGDVVSLAVLPYEVEGRDVRKRAAQVPERVEDAFERAGVPSRVEVRAGAPGDAIIRYADEVSASLIVIGRRGSGLKRLLLGFVSSHVAQNARGPVALVT